MYICVRIRLSFYCHSPRTYRYVHSVMIWLWRWILNNLLLHQLAWCISLWSIARYNEPCILIHKQGQIRCLQKDLAQLNSLHEISLSEIHFDKLLPKRSWRKFKITFSWLKKKRNKSYHDFSSLPITVLVVPKSDRISLSQSSYTPFFIIPTTSRPLMSLSHSLLLRWFRTVLSRKKYYDVLKRIGVKDSLHYIQ